MEKKRLGKILIEAGVLTPEQLDEALNDQKLYGGMLGTILFEKSFITEEDFFNALTSKLGIPAVNFTDVTIPESVIKLVPEEMAFKYAVFPVFLEKNNHGLILHLAMSDPTNIDIIEEIEFTTETRVEPALSLDSTIRYVIQDYYHNQNGKGSYRLKSEAKKDLKTDGEELLSKIENQKTYDPEIPEAFLPRDPDGESSKYGLEERVSKLQKELWVLLDLLDEKGTLLKDEFMKALNRS